MLPSQVPPIPRMHGHYNDGLPWRIITYPHPNFPIWFRNRDWTLVHSRMTMMEKNHMTTYQYHNLGEKQRLNFSTLKNDNDVEESRTAVYDCNSHKYPGAA